MKLQIIGVGVLIAGGALALWRWEVAATELEAKAAQVESLEQRLSGKDAELLRLGGALRSEVERAARLVEVERGIQALRQTLDAQGAEQRATFEELKSNDEAVRDYLSRGVPEPIGLFYQRPATTDPAKYRQGGTVPADLLPSSGAGSASDQ